jgi:hypothetical protein
MTDNQPTEAHDPDCFLSGGDVGERVGLKLWSDEEGLRQLALLYNHKDDDSPQFTRWNMLVAMDHGRRIQARAAKPEPTEDHLRRACEELNADRGYVAWHAEEHQDFSPVRTVARLLAEREAMQARVERPVAQWQRRLMYPEAPGAIPQWENCPAAEATGHFEKRPGYEYRPLYNLPDEPTPDPDLVLAREAAAQAFAELDWNTNATMARNGEIDNMPVVQSALRALKLAKEQAHDQP